MLRCTRDTGSDVDGGLHDLAGLADLHRVGNPAGVDDRTTRTGGAADGGGQFVDERERIGLAQASTTGDHDGRLVKLRAVGLFDMAVRHLGGSDRAKIRHIEILGVGLGPTDALGLERLRTDEEDARLARRVLGADVSHATEDRLGTDELIAVGFESHTVGDDAGVELHRQTSGDIAPVLGGAQQERIRSVDVAFLDGVSDGCGNGNSLQATVEVARAVDGLGAVLAELLGKVIAVARHEHLDGVGQLTSRSEHLERDGGDGIAVRLTENPDLVESHDQCLLENLEIVEEGDDALVGVALVLDDFAGLTSGGVGDRNDFLTGAGPTDRTGVDAKTTEVELVDRLGLGRHDALERRVAGLDHTSGHGDQCRQRALDLVVTGFGLALHLGSTAINGDRLRKGHRREIHQGGDLLRNGARVAVARLGRSEDQIGLLASDRRSENLCRAERIGALQGFVADQRGACRAHRKGGAQTGRLVIWSHRHEVNFAFTGSVDKLQSHLDPVGIRLVEDELRIPNERLALGIERTRVGRIRDLLYTDNNLHTR